MTNEKKITVHTDSAGQDPLLGTTGPDHCPDCEVAYEVGFGMAGGGMGVYTYCPQCGKLLSKTQEEGDG